jgi:hypothetical protein
LQADQEWHQVRPNSPGDLPTRGEFLIRPGGVMPMRPVLAVLELRYPYLAWVTPDPFD